MLRLTVPYTDQWNEWISERSGPEETGSLCAFVDEACNEVGRDPVTLVRTLTISVNPLDGKVQGSSGMLTGPPLHTTDISSSSRTG